MLDRYPVRSRLTAYRTIDRLALVVGSTRGTLLTLNEVGTLIWERADGKHKLSDIVDQVCEQFDVRYIQAAHDAQFFVGELARKDVLALVDRPAGVP